MSHFRLFTTHSLLVIAQGLRPIAGEYDRAREMLEEIDEVLERRPSPDTSMDEAFSEIAGLGDVYANDDNWPDVKNAMLRWIDEMEDAARTIAAEEAEDAEGEEP